MEATRLLHSLSSWKGSRGCNPGISVLLKPCQKSKHKTCVIVSAMGSEISSLIGRCMSANLAVVFAVALTKHSFMLGELMTVRYA